MPNWELEIKKLEMQKQQVTVNKMNIEIRLMELLDEKIRLEANFPSYIEQTKEIDEKIKTFKQNMFDQQKSQKSNNDNEEGNI